MTEPTGGEPEQRRRMLVDGDGVEWELYDDAGMGPASIDWDMPPRQDTPGLYFVSVRDLRRLWPAPETWWQLDDDALRALCLTATSMLR